MKQIWKSESLKKDTVSFPLSIAGPEKHDGRMCFCAWNRQKSNFTEW